MEDISSLISQMTDMTVIAPGPGALLSLVTSFVLLVGSAFCSSSETAFFSLSPLMVSELKQRSRASDRRVLSLLREKDYLLATILITNNLMNVGIIMLCNHFFMSVFRFNSPLAEFVILTVLLTFLLLLFGEVIPKIFSTQKALLVCRTVSGPLLVCSRLMRPFSGLLVRSTSFLDKRFHHKHHNIGVEELSHALELTDAQEIKQESEYLKGIIRFGQETASEIMTPRVDMVLLDEATSYSRVLASVVENSYSRIPVFRDNEDTITGVLYTKDLLPHLREPDGFRWQHLVRPALFVPGNKKLDDLLHEFQTGKVHMAIVVDEFGCTLGLVTMEDVIEEIVGDISDEYDEDMKSFTRISDREWVFQGKTLLTDFLRITRLDEAAFNSVSGEAETLAGLLLELNGLIPKAGQVFHQAGCTFEVLRSDRRRIQEVRVILPPSS